MAVENPAGTCRRGIAPDGTAWSSTMSADYGYVKGTQGFDRKADDLPGKDAVDVFIKPGYKGGGSVAYIVNQVDPVTLRFDEHKCVLGADSPEDAREIYLGNYEKGWKGCGSVVARSIEDFRQWVYSNQPKKGALEPYSGWVGVDLDGTLAKYTQWRGKLHIGEPVPRMAERVKNWRKAGREVRIFTARAHDMSNDVRRKIESWCLEHLGEALPVTNLKDAGMEELWDDRAVSVVKNRGTTTKAASALPVYVRSIAKAAAAEWNEELDFSRAYRDGVCGYPDEWLMEKTG